MVWAGGAVCVCGRWVAGARGVLDAGANRERAIGAVTTGGDVLAPHIDAADCGECQNRGRIAPSGGRA